MRRRHALDLLNAGIHYLMEIFSSESLAAACLDDLVQSDPWKDLALYMPDLVEDLKLVDAKGGPHVASGVGLQLHHRIDGQSWCARCASSIYMCALQYKESNTAQVLGKTYLFRSAHQHRIILSEIQNIFLC